MNRAHGGATFAVVAVALALYTATLAPGLLWGGGDFARFQTWAFLGRIEGGVDIFAHPLWVYLAHPFTRLPVRDPAWRANFASAAFAATALGFILRICSMTTRSIAASMLAAGALAVSHTFWLYAVMPKVYSLNALLLSACLYLLLRWRESGNPWALALAGFIYGLGFLNHVVLATASAGLLVFVVLAARQTGGVGRAAMVFAGCLALGLAPFAILASHSGSSSATVAAALRFLGGLAYLPAHPLEVVQGIGWAVALGLYQFPLTAPLAAAGLVRLRRTDPALAACVGLIALGTTAFLFGALDPATGGAYVWNLHYYLIAYVAAAPALAHGFVWLERSWTAQRPLRWALLAAATLIFPPLLYAAAPPLARRVAIGIPDFRPLPGRDNLAYVLTPWKQGETGPRAYVQAMLDAVPEGAVLFADYGPWAMLHYVQVVERARPDVEVVLLRTNSTQLPEILSRSGTRPMFLADTYRYYDLPRILEHFYVIPDHGIFRLEDRTDPSDRSDRSGSVQPRAANVASFAAGSRSVPARRIR